MLKNGYNVYKYTLYDWVTEYAEQGGYPAAKVSGLEGGQADWKS